MSRSTFVVVTAAALGAAGGLAGCGAAAQSQSAAAEAFTLESESVAIYNLAGAAEILSHPGPDVVVEVRRGGADGGELGVEVGEVGGREALRVRYPDDRIRYSAGSGGGSTTVRVRNDGTFGGSGSDGWLSFLTGRGRVRISTSSGDLEAWADLRVLVPEGRDVELHLAFGETRVDGVSAPLSLDVGRGSVRVAETRGRLRVDTGSGRIEVRGVEGDADLDTGSGSVHAEDVRGGRVRIDTGSGSVQLAGVAGERVSVDTGSGSVRGERVDTRSLRVDTGSGDVRLASLSAPSVEVDTGSGAVIVEMDGDVDRLHVDTGSGSVRLRLPESAGARIQVDTGSGGIDVDLPVRIESSRRGRLRAELGDGAGLVRIETGSGGVRIGS